MREKKILFFFVLAFLAAYFIPFHHLRIQGAVLEGFFLLQEYARQHILFCLVPAFFIAGAISVFISQASIIKYLGARANKFLSYSLASISGTILAVCSCTVLPLFSSIYMRGAGIGPATAFLYSGPAINVLAIILTAKVLGFELGLARAAGAISFSVIIGLLMRLFFGGEDRKNRNQPDFVESPETQATKPLWKTVLYFAAMIGILVFINWGKADPSLKAWSFIYRFKWFIGGAFFLALAWMLGAWFKKEELKEWTFSTWIFAKQIFPLLLGGVLFAGFLLGRPGHEGLIPSQWITKLVGGNSLAANLFASVSGALMYFATLTEVPILQGLIGAGMGKGPALAMLLAGPALSLPSMLVLRSIMGTKKTVVYILLVVLMAMVSGLIYGAVAG